MEVNIPGVISIVVFYLIMLAIGIWAGRRSFQKKEEGEATEVVMLAGRSLGFVIGSITLTATWVGGGYINGTAEAVAKPGVGLIHCQAPFCYAISLIVGGFFFAKKMRAAGHITMLDPLSERFGSRMGGILFLPALMAETFWSAAVLSALGAALQVIIGLDNTVAIIVSACIAVVYTVFGGLYSVAYTDVVQLVFIPIGLWLCFPFALNNDAVTPLNETKSQWLGTFDPDLTGSYLDAALMMILGGLPWQAYFQRVLGAKTPNTARAMSFVAGVACFISAVPAVCIGAVAASTDWSLTNYTGTVPLGDSDYQLVVPMVMQYLCPVWVSFIGLGAVSAAVMSSADSSILSASSMFARNVWKLVIRQKASEREVIWVMRVAILFVGTLAATLAIAIQSVYTLFHLCSDFVYVILFPQLAMVVYNDTVNLYGSAVAYIVGLTLRLLGGEPHLNVPAAVKFPLYDENTHTQQFPFKTFAMLISWILLLVVSYVTKYLFVERGLSLKYDFFKCFHDGRSLYELEGMSKSRGSVDGEGFKSPVGTQETLVEYGTSL